MAGRDLSTGFDPSWPTPISSSVEMTERGLVYAGGSLLVRMRKNDDDRQDLAVGTDRERMLAMLTVAFGRHVDASDVLPHVETAADLWRRGEKALANLRLAFAGLAVPNDPASNDRVTLAACLLDHGWPPAALLEELGLAGEPGGFEKYNPNHVPAGHGSRSGQFDFRSGSSGTADGRIVVAGNADDAKEDRERQVLGGGTLKERTLEGHPITPESGEPIAAGGAAGAKKTIETFRSLARASIAKLGPGKGSVYGTRVHTDVKNQIRQMGRDDLHPEQSYLNGRPCDYGTPGSARVDLAVGAVECPDAFGELKTGNAKLTRSQLEHFRLNLPKGSNGEDIPIHEVRP